MRAYFSKAAVGLIGNARRDAGGISINRYNRLNLLKASALCVTVALVAHLSFADTSPKPNILLILADDLAWNDAGCYGNPEVRTPNIDKLSKQGLTFTQAFTATAMCAPTRQQLYTGVFPVRNGAYPNHSKVKKGTRSIVHHLQALGYRVGLKGKKHFGPAESFPFDKPKSITEYMTKDNAPFCLIFASHHPHPKWPQPKGYDPNKITVPPFLVDNVETRQALCRYYTAVTAFDTEVGDYLDRLQKSGKADNTIVIVTSEQGPDFPGGKWTCYDYGLRTQFIVKWPDVISPDKETAAMIQYVDVAPTLIEIAGGNPEDIDTGLNGGPNSGRGFDGRSFMSLLRGKATQHNNVVFGVHTTQGIIAGKPYPVRSIRDRRYKYIINLMPEAMFQNIMTEKNYENIWNSWIRDAKTDKRAARLTKRYQHRPPEEFYDVDRDPFEQNNLADQPQYREQMNQMKEQLEAWMARQGDRGVKTETGKFGQ
ncbi:MAG: sulfatase [Kiritimatiellae bacterium]|nr:sulfatase [Kiritimatiellia bacterium]